MKVIAINGSPRKNSNTGEALELAARELAKESIDTEIIQIGNRSIQGCRACVSCAKAPGNHCAITEDCVNEIIDKVRAADGLILACPTYFAGIAGTMKCFCDRLFYTSRPYFKGKVGMSITAVRRAGGVDTIHQLNNYFNLAEMVIAPSQYWVSAFGMIQGEIIQDAEGLQTIKRSTRAMAWLLKMIEAGKNTFPYPVDPEPRARTNFIR